jgi:hypothetical protein
MYNKKVDGKLQMIRLHCFFLVVHLEEIIQVSCSLLTWQYPNKEFQNMTSKGLCSKRWRNEEWISDENMFS